MDSTTLLPEVIQLYIRSMQQQEDLQLSFKILDNSNSKKLIISWRKPLQHDWRPNFRRKKSPSELLRDNRRKQQFQASQADRPQQQHSVTQRSDELIQSTDFESQVNTPLIPRHVSHCNNSLPVFDTPQISNTITEECEGAVGGVPDDQTLGSTNILCSSSGTDSTKPPKNIPGRKAVKPDAARKDSLRSSAKAKVTFKKVPSQVGTFFRKHYEKSGAVDLAICTKCLEDKEQLLDELMTLKKKYGMRIGDGDVFTWKCVDCNRTESISDSATLNILR